MEINWRPGFFVDIKVVFWGPLNSTTLFLLFFFPQLVFPPAPVGR